MLAALLQDLRIRLRVLLRSPMMAATIVSTVGLGIGASTAIFSAIEATLLRPLPYQDPGRLVRIFTDAPPNRYRFSLADYRALEAQQTHFESVAAYTDRSLAFSDGAVAERVRGREVSWTYFGLLGIRPALGRDFRESDGRPGSPPAVIVSHGFWLRRLGGRPGVVGETIRLDGEHYQLAGVLPPAVGPLERGQDLFVAARWDPPARKGPFLYTALGRLRKGVDRLAAAEELRAINRRIFPEWRASYQDERASWGMMDLKAFVVGDVGTLAGVALAAVGLVWLIACANAANLLIARVTSRRRELAIRAALGASRARVARHLLGDSALLAALSGALGIALAAAGVGLLRDVGGGYLPRALETSLDGPALGLLALLTAASVLLFGLAPAAHATSQPLGECLRALGRSATGSPAARRLRRALVGGQFAIATPLLVVAALLLVSLSELGRVDLGFDTRNLLSGAIALPAAQYREEGAVAAFWDELQRRVAALPGVAGVAFADGRAPNEVGNFNNFDLEDSPTPPGRSQPVTPWVSVTPAYLDVLGLAVLEGRSLDERDALRPDLESVVVDRAWARRFFPGGSAVGRRFREGGCTECPWTTVVGVVGDVKYAGLDRPDSGSVYWPMAPNTRFRFLLLRTRVDPRTLLPSLRQVLRELDPSLPLSDVATVDDLVARSLARPLSLSLLVAAFAVLALVLSVVGIYGVMGYYVEQHSKDIGIRMALGASRGHVLRRIVGQGMAVVSGGVFVGLLVAVAAARLVSGLLFRVGADDVPALAGVGTFLLGAALVACYFPASRAVDAPPAVVLRSE